MAPSRQGQWAPPQPPNAWVPQQGQQAPWPTQQQIPQQAPWMTQQPPPPAPPAPPQWGPPPQGPWGPPPPPKQSKRVGIWIAIGAVVAIGIGGVATASSDDKPAAGKANGSETGKKSSTQKAPLDHSEDASITSCGKDGTTGWPVARVKVTNNSSKPSNYVITVAFTSADGSEQYDTGLAPVNNLNPGQSTTVEANSLKDGVPAGFVCKIEDSTRYSAVG